MTNRDLELIEEINQIEDRYFKDLLWLLISPALESQKIKKELKLFTSTYEILFKWYHTVKHKKINIPNKKLPLGRYAEHLLSFFIMENDRFELMEQNYQLNEKGISVGEVDFLIYDRLLLKNWHVEFALKYYLKVSVNNETQFIGINTVDQMDQKINKLIHFQSQQTNINRHLLPDYLQNIDFASKIVLKGALFYPIEEWLSRKENCFEGWWTTIQNLEMLLSTAHSFMVITEKRDWIFPYQINTKSYQQKQLKSHLEDLFHSNKPNAYMVVRINREGNFIDRGFIVRESWPFLN